jgi:hypothetical protein
MNVVLLVSDLYLAPTTAQFLTQNNAATLPALETNVEVPESAASHNGKKQG